MGKRVWLTGRRVSSDQPTWAPLQAVVASLTNWFMWMGEVRLDNGVAVHAYKHRSTRRYLHLDQESRPYTYEFRRERAMYREITLAQALGGVFAGWPLLGDAGSPEELALARALIDVALTLD